MKATIELPHDLVIVAPLPELVSQHNVAAVLGIPANTFLDMVRRATDLEVMKLGKLRLVDRAAFVAWLKGEASRTMRPANDSGGTDAEEDLIKELGLAHVPVSRHKGRR